LYADWSKRDSTLVTKDEFSADLYNSYSELRKFGIKKQNAPFFLPPYEWYNNEISGWVEELGLTLVNFSPGTTSNGDYTVPNEGTYYTSNFIFNKILKYERESPNGLNGFMLLTHFGTDPRRTDKFYDKLENLIIELQNRGYKFVSLPELMK
jgi:peptidoglycan/xylan/chitin deacetylase (PgdA/CDA1 family)